MRLDPLAAPMLDDSAAAGSGATVLRENLTGAPRNTIWVVSRTCCVGLLCSAGLATNGTGFPSHFAFFLSFLTRSSFFVDALALGKPGNSATRPPLTVSRRCRLWKSRAGFSTAATRSRAARRRGAGARCCCIKSMIWSCIFSLILRV